MFNNGFGGMGLRGSSLNLRQASPFRPVMQTSLAGNVLGAPFALGQTGREWYDRAKTAVIKFENLLGRVARIANQTARNEILEWVGSAATPGTPAYRYNSVLSDIAYDVERFTPPNYGAYDIERRQNRVEKLEDFNETFATMVTNAEDVYGRLPAPVVITVPGAATEVDTTDYTLPLAIGAGGIALAVILTKLL